MNIPVTIELYWLKRFSKMVIYIYMYIYFFFSLLEYASPNINVNFPLSHFRTEHPNILSTSDWTGSYNGKHLLFGSVISIWYLHCFINLWPSPCKRGKAISYLTTSFYWAENQYRLVLYILVITQNAVIYFNVSNICLSMHLPCYHYQNRVVIVTGVGNTKLLLCYLDK